MMEIEAFDEKTVNELRGRARNLLLTAAITNEEQVEHSIEDLLKIEGMDGERANQLIKTVHLGLLNGFCILNFEVKG